MQNQDIYAQIVNASQNVYGRPVTSILCIAAIALTCLPLLHSSLVDSGDWVWHLRWMRAYFESWQQGVWWPVWLADVDHGLGSPVFAFYAPGSFVLAAVRQSTGFHVLTAYKILMGAGIAGLISAGAKANGAFGAWMMILPSAFLAYVWQTPAGLLGAAALCWTALLWQERKASATTLLLTICVFFHTLSALMAVAYLWLNVATAGTKGIRTQGLLVAKIVLIAAILGAVAWLPAISLQNLIDVSYLTEHSSFQIRCNLFFGLTDNCGAYPSMRPWLYVVEILLAFSTLGLVIVSRVLSHRLHQQALVVLILLLLTTIVALPVYIGIVPLAKLQFGWRWWPLIFLSTLMLRHHVAQILPAEGKIRLRYVSVLVLALSSWLTMQLLPGFQLLMPARDWVSVAALESAIESTTLATPEHRPSAAFNPPNRREKLNYWIETQRIVPALSAPGAVRIEVIKTHHHEKVWRIDMAANGPAQIKTFCFSGWRASTENGHLPLICEAPQRTISVQIPKGSHQISLRYEHPAIFYIAAALSGFGILLFWRMRRLSA